MEEPLVPKELYWALSHSKFLWTLLWFITYLKSMKEQIAGKNVSMKDDLPIRSSIEADATTLAPCGRSFNFSSAGCSPARTTIFASLPIELKTLNLQKTLCFFFSLVIYVQKHEATDMSPSVWQQVQKFQDNIGEIRLWRSSKIAQLPISEEVCVMFNWASANWASEQALF